MRYHDNERIQDLMEQEWSALEARITPQSFIDQREEDNACHDGGSDD